MEYKGHIWTAVLTLLVGVALIFLHKITAEAVVLILGATFIATGAITAFMQYNRRDAKGKRKLSATDILTALASIILGIWMVTDPGGNISVIIRLIGIGVTLAGGFQIFSMLIKWRQVPFPVWFYACPVLVTGCGLFMICKPNTFASGLVLITGIALVIYSISSIMQIFALMSFEKQMKNSGARQYTPDNHGEYSYVEENSTTDVKPRANITAGKDESGPWPSDRR